MAKYFGLKEMGVSIGISLFLLWSLSSHGFCDTTLLVDFDDGYDASFSVGEGAANTAPELKEGDVKLVDGKFGKGVFIGRDVPALALNYATKDNFSYKEGTLEFWFRPEWDSNAKDESYKDSKGKPEWLHAYLFSTSGSPTRFQLVKSRYGRLTFSYRKKYKTTASVTAPGRDFFQQGEWIHIAVSWDGNEARIFLNGKLASVSEEWDVAGKIGGRIALGSLGYGTGHGAWGTFDDFRISDNKKYTKDFTLPESPLGVEEGSDKL